jgi:hypothetical protein
VGIKWLRRSSHYFNVQRGMHLVTYPCQEKYPWTGVGLTGLGDLTRVCLEEYNRTKNIRLWPRQLPIANRPVSLFNILEGDFFVGIESLKGGPSLKGTTQGGRHHWRGPPCKNAKKRGAFGS